MFVILVISFLFQPFVIHDMETLHLAERTLVAKMVGTAGGLLDKDAEVRIFHCCQCTSVETVTELTEFAKSVPGFCNLDLNDQVGRTIFAIRKLMEYLSCEFRVLRCFCIVSSPCLNDSTGPPSNPIGHISITVLLCTL